MYVVGQDSIKSVYVQAYFLVKLESMLWEIFKVNIFILSYASRQNSQIKGFVYLVLVNPRKRKYAVKQDDLSV